MGTVIRSILWKVGQKKPTHTLFPKGEVSLSIPGWLQTPHLPFVASSILWLQLCSTMLDFFGCVCLYSCMCRYMWGYLFYDAIHLDFEHGHPLAWILFARVFKLAGMPSPRNLSDSTFSVLRRQACTTKSLSIALLTELHPLSHSFCILNYHLRKEPTTVLHSCSPDTSWPLFIACLSTTALGHRILWCAVQTSLHLE